MQELTNKIFFTKEGLFSIPGFNSALTSDNVFLLLLPLLLIAVLLGLFLFIIRCSTAARFTHINGSHVRINKSFYNKIGILLIPLMLFGICALLVCTFWVFSRSVNAQTDCSLSDSKVHINDFGDVYTDDFYLENTSLYDMYNINNISFNVFDNNAADCKVTLYSEFGDILFNDYVTQEVTLSNPISIERNSKTKFSFAIGYNKQEAEQFVDKSPFGFKFKISVIEHKSSKILLDDDEGLGGDKQIYVDTLYGFFADENLTQPISKVSVPSYSNHDFKGYVVEELVGSNDALTDNYMLTDPDGNIIGNPAIFWKTNLHVFASWDFAVSKINLLSQDRESTITVFYEKYNCGYYSDEACQNLITSISVPEDADSAFFGAYTKDGQQGHNIIDHNGVILSSNVFFTDKEYYIYSFWINAVCAIEIYNSDVITPDLEPVNTIYEKFGFGFYDDQTLSNLINSIDVPAVERGKAFTGYYFVDDYGITRQFCSANGNIECSNMSFTQETNHSFWQLTDAAKWVVTVDLCGAVLKQGCDAPDGWLESADYNYVKSYFDGDDVADIIAEWEDADVVAGVAPVASPYRWSITSGSVTDNIKITTDIILKDSLEYYSFDEIKAISSDLSKNFDSKLCSRSFYYDKFANLAENSSIKTVSDENGNIIMHFRIVDINHDVLADSDEAFAEYAGLTFMTLDAFPEHYYYNNPNTTDDEDYCYNWESSSLRKDLNSSESNIGAFINENIDPDNNLVVSVTKKYAKGWTPNKINNEEKNAPSETYSSDNILQCSDKYFVPSFKEITGQLGEYDPVTNELINLRGDEGEKYKYISNDFWSSVANWDAINDYTMINPEDEQWNKWTNNPGPMLANFSFQCYNWLTEYNSEFHNYRYQTIHNVVEAMYKTYYNPFQYILDSSFKYADWFADWERSFTPQSPYTPCVYKFNGYPNDNCSIQRKASVAFMFCM